MPRVGFPRVRRVATAAIVIATALIVVGCYGRGAASTAARSGAAVGVIPAGQFTSLHVAGALAVAPDGALYVVDVTRDRILVRSPDGRFRVVAGNGTTGFAGDGGPAVRAELSGISALAVARSGTLYIADAGRVRAVGRDGVIRTIAGDGRAARPLASGAPGTITSGTPAPSASLGSRWSIEHRGAPLSVALNREGQLYVSTSSQILRLTDTGRLDVVRAIVPSGPAAGPLNSIGSIAVTARGDVDVGGLELGWSIWRVTPNGVAREVGYARCCDGRTATVETAPNGVGYGESGAAILRITSRKLVPAFSFVTNVNGQYFSPGYFAFGPTGTIYVDDIPGNTGFEAHQQLLSVSAGRLRLLWQEDNAAPK